MSFRLFTLSILLVTITACATKVPASTQETEASELEVLLNEIKALASSESCTEPADWSYVAYGAKPCGGPWGYLAYSNKIDTASFLDLVQELRIAELAYNEKWNSTSDCLVSSEPQSVDCKDGTAILVY